jgi:hypothetical protein
MGYIENNLSPKEKLMARPVIHWFVLVNGPLVTAAGAMLRSDVWGTRTGYYLYHANTRKVWWTLSNYDTDDVIELAINALPYLAIMAGIYLTVVGIFRKFGIDYGITSRRVVQKEGMFHTDTDELSFNDIESIEIHQSPFGKLLDFGDITFNGISYNTEKRTITFRWVSNPSKIRRIALAGLDAYAPATPKSLLES